ncbi:zinc-dependent alcohol dehydrogenase [Paenibacillus senegalensis]|uniref:zinc-dependent alcohol dehydrogenase n=1 Tax=Paenibacillus senegalensis TaxID=1465766 RepID=UPI000289DB2D|nr:zinc-binding dehydrogenase [Paenibacillus senegalensis]
MTDKMRFAVLVKAGQAEVRERMLPELKDHQVLIKHEACNICTTDYGQWMGLREHQPYPMAGGHECSGQIIAKGSAVGDDLMPGDRVGIAYGYCGICDACKVGLTGECKQMSGAPTEDGYYGDFGFSDYYVRDAKSLVKMNPELSPGEAAFLEPLATVVKGLRKLRLSPMETVAIIGAGTMGLVNAQAARAYGARVIITEIMDKKIKTAEAMGFDVIRAHEEDPVQAVRKWSGGHGTDAVIIAVGATIANDQAIEMVKKWNGRVLLFAAGYPAPELRVDSNSIHYRKMELIGTYGADMADFMDSARLLNDKLVDVSLLIEKSYVLDDIQAAYETASTPGSYRVSVKL